jgi:transposase-like protein
MPPTFPTLKPETAAHKHRGSYSEAFKSEILRRLDGGESVYSVMMETGLTRRAISLWRQNRELALSPKKGRHILPPSPAGTYHDLTIEMRLKIGEEIIPRADLAEALSKALPTVDTLYYAYTEVCKSKGIEPQTRHAFNKVIKHNGMNKALFNQKRSKK